MKASKKNHIRLIRGIAAVMSAGLVLSMAGCGGGETTGSGTGASEATYKTVDLQQRKIKIYQYGFRKNTITSTESGKRILCSRFSGGKYLSVVVGVYSRSAPNAETAP